MSDTTIVEEQAPPEGGEPEVAEGHQFLLKGDLDPDAQGNPAVDGENILAEETDKTPPEKDTASAPEAEEEAKPEEAAPELHPKAGDKDTAVEPREIKGIKIGDKVYPDEAALGAAYQTAEQTIGRQGDHIGELKSRITMLEGQVPRSDGVDDPEPERDDLDPESVKNWNAWNRRDLKREIVSDQAAQVAEDAQKQQIAVAQAAQDETQAFLESHPDLSVKQLLEVTRLRGERGISYEKALSEVGNSQPEKEPVVEPIKPAADKPPEKPKEEPDAAARKKQEEADKVGKNLSEGGGAAKVGIDLDTATPQEWGEAKKDMTQREIDAHLAGDDLE